MKLLPLSLHGVHWGRCLWAKSMELHGLLFLWRDGIKLNHPDADPELRVRLMWELF